MICQYINCKKRIKKIYLQLHLCKCKQIFCDIHKNIHNCSFGYLQYNKNELNQKLEKVCPQNIKKI